MTAYETGKTSWLDQEYAASDAIVKALRRNGVIVRREQIMDESLLNEAAIHKTAAIIYAGLGNGYRDRVKDANAMSDATLPTKFPEVDTNADGFADRCEKTTNTTWLTR